MAINWENPFNFSDETISDMKQVGLVTQIFGSVNQAIGGYYQAETAKYQLKSKALSYQHQEDMAKINSRMIESQAQQLQRAYDRNTMMQTMKSGQAKSSYRASTAARGVALNDANTAEIEAGQEILKEIDKITINSNKVRAVNETRMKGVAVDISGMMANVSAQNLLASADNIKPWMGVGTTLLTGAGNFMQSYYTDAAQANILNQLTLTNSPSNATPKSKS
jgi:hypothetical protein